MQVTARPGPAFLNPQPRFPPCLFCDPRTCAIAVEAKSRGLSIVGATWPHVSFRPFSARSFRRWRVRRQLSAGCLRTESSFDGAGFHQSRPSLPCFPHSQKFPHFPSFGYSTACIPRLGDTNSYWRAAAADRNSAKVVCDIQLIREAALSSRDSSSALHISVHVCSLSWAMSTAPGVNGRKR
jgi:hypothetical protein